MRVMFLTDAGSMGLGHFTRSFALLQALKQLSDCECILSMNSDGVEYAQEMGVLLPGQIIVRAGYDDESIRTVATFQPDIVVLDSYRYDLDYVCRLRTECQCPIVEFDDYMRYPADYIGDVVINGNVFAHEHAEQYKVCFKDCLLGLEFLSMKKWSSDQVEGSSYNVNSVMLTCGGYDTIDIMYPLANALSAWEGVVSVVIGPFFTQLQIEKLESVGKGIELIMHPSGLQEHILRHDIVITAAGTTAYEVLRAKRKMVLIQTADNQAQTLKRLGENCIPTISMERLAERDYLFGILSTVANDENFIDHPLYEMVDGNGATRLANELVKVVERWKRQ